MSIIPQNGPQKQCKDCKEFFPTTGDFFYPANGNTGGLMKQCIPCRSIYMKNHYARHHPKPEAPIPPEGHKFCIRCSEPKLINHTNFRPLPRGKEGFQNVCRTCVNEQSTKTAYKRNKEHPPEFSENTMKQCSTCPQSYPATPRYFDRNIRKKDGLEPRCKECKKQQSKVDRMQNPDKHTAQKFIYREKNRETLRAKGREYVRAHRAEQNARWQHRNGLIIRSETSYTARDVQDQYNAQGGKCEWCKDPLTKYHVDHIIAVTRGGSNGPENIVLACPPCNISKGNKTLDEWLAYLEKFILPRKRAM